MNKLTRLNRAKKNIVFGFINRMASLLLSFILRTLMIDVLGVEYIGLNTIYTSILGFLSLAELGFGSAMVYNMYRPIAEGNDEKVCALLAYYKKVNCFIGLTIFGVGLVLVPFLPYLVKYDKTIEVNIYVIYIISLISTTCTYFIGGYKASLLNALQRNDLQSKTETIVLTLRYTVEITLLLIFRNYYAYVVVAPIFSIALNIIIVHISNKKYPNYLAKGEISKEEKSKVAKKMRSLFVYSIGQVVMTYADTLVISAFLGVKILGMYQNYYMIITMLFGFLQVVYNSIQAGVGNMLVSEDKDNVYLFFNTILLAQAIICGWCSICLLCMYKPFIQVWIGDECLLPPVISLLLAFYFFQWKIRDIVVIFKSAGGLWDQDRFRPLISALVNLSLNLVLVHFWGLSGVIFSTILAGILIDLPWGAWVLYHEYFKKSIKIYLIKIIRYTVTMVIIGALCYYICFLVGMEGGWKELVVNALICVFVALPLLLTIYKFDKTSDDLIARVKRVFKK